MSVRLQGVDHTVFLADQIVSEDDLILLGESNTETASVYIRSGMTWSKKEQVAIHEFTHLLMEGEPDAVHSEGFVTRFANNWYAFLKDNSLLAEGWLERIIDGFEEVAVTQAEEEEHEHDSIRPVDRPA